MMRLKNVLQAHGYRGTREYDAGLPSGPDFLRFVCDAAGVTLEVQIAKTAFQRERSCGAPLEAALQGSRRPRI
jgi:hypothetical protein